MVILFFFLLFSEIGSYNFKPNLDLNQKKLWFNYDHLNVRKDIIKLDSNVDWAGISTFLEDNVDDMAFMFLMQEINLKQEVLERIIVKYSWILYLKVDTNLRPTIEVFRSYGYTNSDICAMVSRIPSVLAINHEKTLPQKLKQLENDFNLEGRNLIDVTLAQPTLLTSSFDRNSDISTFLTDVVGLTKPQVGDMLKSNPTIAATSITILSAAWMALINAYGFSSQFARSIVLKNSYVLSKKTLRNITGRVKLFEEIGLPSPYPELQKILLRFPALIYVDVNYFLKPNVAILTGYFGLDEEELFKLVSTCAQLLTYNPMTLTSMLQTTTSILTSKTTSFDPKPYLRDNTKDSDDESSSFSSKISHDEEDLSVSSTSSVVLEEMDDTLDKLCYLDMVDSKSSRIYSTDKIRRIVKESFRVTKTSVGDLSLLQKRIFFDGSSALMERHGVAVGHANSKNLCVDWDRARAVMIQAPWVLTYTPHRTQSVLATLSTTLCLTKEELSKIIGTYPRLLSLSPDDDAKLNQVLNELAVAAARVLEVEIEAGTDLNNSENWRPRSKKSKRKSLTISKIANTTKKNIDSESCIGDDNNEENPKEDGALLEAMLLGGKPAQAAIYQRRKDPLRRMLREVIIRYPLMLGTAMTRIEERLEDFVQLIETSGPVRTTNGTHSSIGKALRWDGVVQVLRRGVDAHIRWRDVAMFDVTVAIEKLEKETEVE